MNHTIIKLFNEFDLFSDAEQNNICPLFVCEWCNKPILNHYAMFFYYMNKDGEFSDVHIAHKGDCEKLLHKKIGGDERQMWDDICNLLIHLTINSGILDNENTKEKLFKVFHQYISEKSDK